MYPIHINIHQNQNIAMGGVFSALSSWFCKQRDIDNLIGQTVIDIDIVNDVQSDDAPILVLTTTTADVYMGHCIDNDSRVYAMHVIKDGSNIKLDYVGKGNCKPFVVTQIYRDRHGLSKLFYTRCWVIVDENENIYELYITDLDLFSDIAKLSEESLLKNSM